MDVSYATELLEYLLGDVRERPVPKIMEQGCMEHRTPCLLI
jgi:hypothetical protein